MTYKQAMTISKMWFDFWINNPDKETWIFNEIEIAVSLSETCYSFLVAKKYLVKIENSPPELKKELWNEVLRIAPKSTKEKRIKIARTIYLFGYLSNT